jgi:hypothetical protein
MPMGSALARVLFAVLQGCTGHAPEDQQQP